MANNRAYYLLVVDDDKNIHQFIKELLPAHWKMFSVQNYENLSYDRFYHAAFIDMHLIPGSKQAIGPKVISQLVKINPQLEAIAMSGDLSRDLMEACLQLGAQKFISKPLFEEEVLLTLSKIEALWELRQIESVNESQRARWVGKSAASEKIRKSIASLKGETGTVLIEGETGCGKEVAARLLHQQEPTRPFITVNIASIAENLFESEMFGHVKGSFTGADQNKIGLIEAANGGDLFLDEIEALPLSQQVKLLRFLESGEVRKVGAKETMQIKCRVIVASNKPLDKMVQKNEFREDLYFRLISQKLTLPPLRERKEDIPELANYFLDLERPRRNKTFAEDGLEQLSEYHFPGNVRELKRICEQLALTAPLPFIRSEDVLSWIKPSAVVSAPHMIGSQPQFSLGLVEIMSLYEKEVIKKCFELYPNIDEVSQTLKISKSSLYKKIKEYGLEGDLK